MTMPPAPTTGPPGKKPGILAWAKKNKGLAAGGAAGVGLVAFILYKRNQANAAGDTSAASDTSATNTPAGTIPAQFDGSGGGGGGDVFGPIEQQLAGLQTSINAITQSQNPPPGGSTFSFYALAKELLQKAGNKNPTKAEIEKERTKLIKQLGPPPAKKPNPNPHKPTPKRFPGGKIVVGKRK